ncbi:hypothetical protein BGZ93_002412 [Podila epicladia]|nr:hypothetical protein BGZ92_004422 [Podila epicladia]KAG0082488.1 hypothetical protein BGZ93_002412 [Podila epicladia]
MLPSNRLLSLAASVALIFPMVQAQSNTTVVQTPTSAEPPTSSSTTTTTTTTTATITTVTTVPTIPSTSSSITVPTIPSISSTTAVPTIPTLPTTSSSRTTSITVPRFTTASTTHTSTTAPLPPTLGTSSSSNNSNIPVIVGSIAGVAALAIILITSISCYRRRNRANRELTFDALGLGNTGGGKRNTIPFSSNKPSGAIGLNSVTSGGYDDDDYGYDMQQQGGNGYPSPHQPYNNNHQQQFNNGYDAYGQGVHPTIFNEDHHHGGAYATASSMSRNRMGFDQNLPEVMYRNGEEDQVAAAATGYYDDTGYDVAWSQQMDPNAQYGHGQGGYVNGLWVANPEAQYYGQEQYQDPYQQQQQQEFYDEPLDPLTPPAPSRPVITSAQSENGDATNRHSFNPQAILPATSAVGGSEGEGSQLRSHDLFVQTSEAPVVTSSKSQSPPASPSSRMREMRSMELARQSPTSRPSGEGGRTYADDVQGSVSPTGAGSATLNGQKSLRSRRREDWS